MKVHIGDWPKGSRERKVSVKIDDWDSYSADHTLALIIYPLLLEFREKLKTHPGIPSALVEDDHDEGKKKWDEIIDKMIYSMKEIAEGNPDENQFFKENGKKFETKENEDGSHEVIETGYDFDKDGYDAYHNRLQEGLELFGKYFQNLWW